MTDEEETNTPNTEDQNTQNTTSGCVYDQYGRSPDKKTVCGIGLPSAGADQGSGYQKVVVENYCPQCGNSALRWGWHWEENGETAFAGEGGNAEGHFFCYQGDGGCDADYSAQGNEHIDGSTEKLTIVDGPTPSSEEEATQLIKGQLPCSGNTSGGSVVSGGGGTAIRIPDTTFYGLIKQMIGAIDGIFIVANNMAYLLSFKDMYKYREQYDEFIPKIEAQDVLKNTLTQNWSTSGYYNAIELEYQDGVIKVQNDSLVNKYGENIFHYQFPNDDEETAKAKAEALLSAHTRDYSTDIEVSILYNENITAGSWVKFPKALTSLGKQVNKSVEKQSTKTLNILDINKEVANKYKDKKITEKKDDKYDIFFVQGYTCRWDKKHSLIMDLHLKYGPDTPEDPINATISIGQVTTSVSGGTSGNPAWGDDCFSICDICTENCNKILGKASGRRADAEEYIRQHEADSKYLSGRAKQDSQYAKDVSGKTSQEAYTLFRDKFNYACYSDSCDSAYPCCDDLWTKANAANCGDSTRMLKVLMDATGTPCYGIHVDGHYFNAVQVNGTWHTLDGTRGPTNSSCNFPDSGNYASGSNSCGSGWC